MDQRQAYALAHPLDRADLGVAVLAQYVLDERQVSGNILRSILAVDR